MVGCSMARLVLPHADGNAAATYRVSPAGRGELEDEHVLGQPALVAGHHRGDAQRVALLAEQRVAAVAGAVGPDLAGLGEVRDVLGRVARPRHVGLAGLQRRADRVDGLDERAALARSPAAPPSPIRVMIRIDTTTYGESVISTPSWEISPPSGPMQNGTTYMVRPRMQPSKISPNVWRISAGRDPVVGRAGVLLALGADERAVLDPGDVAGVGARSRSCSGAVPGSAG